MPSLGGDDESEQVNRIDGSIVHGPVVQARTISEMHIHAGAPQVPVPRQLPPAPRQFINRAKEVARLTTLSSSASGAASPAVLVVTGMHGVGKTATSRHWAHLHGDRFSDGHLYADFGELRHRGGVAVGDVLGGFLRALGVPDEILPAAMSERSALFRSRTAGKRVLLLLDDVEHAAQIRPLLPNAPESVVLVTSRSPLEELVGDGAGVVDLVPLAQRSAAELLAALVDEQRLLAEPDAVSELISFCDGLPVALQICAARLAVDPARSVSWLTDQLRDATQRLRRLGYRSSESLEAVFDEAYGALDAEAARAYRRLSWHTGPTFAVAGAAATINVAVGRAADLLESLCHARLLERTGSRYRFHDLLRLHAGGVAARDEPVEEHEAAARRSVGFYLAAAQRMDRAMIADRLRLTDVAPPAGPGEPEFGSSAQAFAWFEAERPNLLAAARVADEHRWDTEAWQIGEALFLGYHNHKHYEEAREVYRLAAAAAERAGHHAAAARMRSQFARALMDLGEHDAATTELAAARDRAVRAKHAGLIASIIEWSGHLALERADADAALESFLDARERFEALDNRRGVALQYYGAGRALLAAGKAEAAVTALRDAERLLDAASDGLTVGRVCLRLGEALRRAGQMTAARAALQRAAAMMSEHDAAFYVAAAYEELAAIDVACDDRQTALVNLRAAHSILAALSSPRASSIERRVRELAGEAR